MSPTVILPAVNTHKYGAEVTVIDGQRFDSKGEAARWSELRLLERAGQIKHLERQVDFELHARSFTVQPPIGRDIADFTYLEKRPKGQHPTWAPVVEDYKGLDTPLSKWKRKHLAAEYGVVVRVTRGKRR
jgi:Protein of unknown function (DUF1064)